MPNLKVANPYDGSELAQVPLADEAEIDAVIAAAHKTFDATRNTQPFDRSRILLSAAEALKKRRGEFADCIVAEAGKPITFAEAEVDRAVNTLTAAAEEARRAAQGEWLDLDAYPPGKGHVGFVKRFPLGVIYGISPFNFPLNLVLHKVAPAIATGNTIVLKPSPRTPMTAIKLGELLAEAGCPKGQVNVIVTPNELAERAAHDPRVRHITFTGSSAIGWKLKQNIPADKRVTLELGGNAPLIIHDDADLNAAIPIAASGAFGYAGQSCISVQRILVQQSIYPTFRDRFLQHIREKIKTGDPRDRSVIVGPMIDADALKRVRSAIDDALRGGAKVLCGNEVIGPCLTPTVIENADPKCPLVAAEVFAPVATLHRYNTFDEALAMANDSVY
ncbi:MAG TPA: aldehyde dehydrogenase family protein, partial [Tepidisphaeraceae bacterium]